MYVTRPSRPTGPAGVEARRRDADLGAEAVPEAVREARRGVVEDARRVHARQELLGGRGVVRHDRLGVVRAVAVHVLDRLVERLHDLHREDGRAVLGPPVVLGSGGEGEGRREARASSRRRAARCPASPRRESSGTRNSPRRLAMDEQRLGRVAGGRVLELRVEDDRRRHRLVRGAVHVDVADALGVAEDRDARRRLDVLDEVVAAARDHEVDVVVEREERVHLGPAADGLERAVRDTACAA